jgi:hypothetical protein
MRRHLRLLSLALSLAVAGPILLGGTVASGTTPYRIRLWMLPPADALGNNACLTQRWHSTDPAYDINRALDWKATCGSNGTELIRFRALASAIDEPYDGTYWPAMTGLLSNLPPSSCGVGTVHIGKVKIVGGDSYIRGFMIYAHTVLTGSTFNINAKNGATLSNAYLTSFGIGDTVSDASAGPNCWQGWHVHENNSDDAVMHWDSWNSKWDTAAVSCDCYKNDSSSNWIRRMTFAWIFGG